ncbi:uncharacterized protein [Ptychodera flava]|uniref:uncharacterized protein n=1 Tax=Ptychodera flava TaxID=63121 RepID=UPI003969FCBD
MAAEATDRQTSHNFPSTKDKATPKKSPSASKLYAESSVSSAQALVIGERGPTHQASEKLNPKKRCHFCEQHHWSDECTKYSTVEARKEKVKGQCYICLKKGHRLKDCVVNKPCFFCRQRKNHHSSLCPKKFPSTRKENTLLTQGLPKDAEPNTEKALMASGEIVLMQTATTMIKNPDSSLKQSVRILFDSGSHRSYITDDLARKLRLKTGIVEEMSIVTFGTQNSKVIKSPVTTLDICLRDGSVMTVTVNIVPQITGTLHRMPINTETFQNWDILWKDIPLADSLPQETETSTIELLIGNDYYLDLILPQIVEVQPGLHLLGSKLGWILTGRTPGNPEPANEPSMLILTLGSQLGSTTPMYTSPDSSLNVTPNPADFWSMEAIGIRDSYEESDDDRALEHFNETVKFENGRYHVKWPWKEEQPDLPENRELAYGRLKTLVQKLSKNPDLLEKYDAIIEEQRRREIIEQLTDASEVGHKKHYIPHHAVINPMKTSTKVRIVYDASAKVTRDSKNLNECLYRGPVMLKDLCGLLLRFRLNKVAMVADIEKAFLQVGLQAPDKDVTRFFWLKDCKIPRVDGNLQTYRFCRIPFGVISSPFLLAAKVDHHLKKDGSQTAQKFRDNIYVDNVITGTDAPQFAYNFYTEAKKIFSNASMNFREWTSNSELLLNRIREQIISDNAPQFKLAKSVLDKVWMNVIMDRGVRKYMTDQGIKWQFVVELAPWMG